MLITNIGENTISEKEFISDINQLKCLAQLQESVVWSIVSYLFLI